MNEIVATVAEIPFFALSEVEQLSTIESSLYPGAKHESIRLVIANCKAQALDPMTKPFHIVPMNVKQRKKDRDGALTNAVEYVWRDVVMPGIELYRTKAARTGLYAGMDPAQWGEDTSEEFGGEPKFEWDEGERKKVAKGTYANLKLTYPIWCDVTVYRIVQGLRCAFPSGRVYWKEIYATAGRDTSLPNEMWRKRTRGQLEKCAEALALRRAFPEIGAVPTVEEMIGKVIDSDAGSGVVVEGAVTEKKIEQPRSKSAAPVAEPSSPPSTDGGGTPADANGGAKLSAGAKETLTKALKRVGKTEADLVAAGFPAFDAMPFARFNEAMKTVKAMKAAA